MNILNTSATISRLPETEQRKAVYGLTHPATCKKIIDLAGRTIHVDQWVIAEDVDGKTGELRNVYYLKTEGEIYASISPTFGRQFNDIVEIFGDVEDIRIVTGKSKNGREFVTCELA